MNNRKYMVAFCCLTATSVALILFIVCSMIVPDRVVRDTEDETNSNMNANTSLITDTTTNTNTSLITDTTTNTNTEADAKVDYLSIFHEGMTTGEMNEAILFEELTKNSDWRMVFVTDGLDSFCLIQKYDTRPACTVSHISVHTFKTPTEADLEILVPDTPITDIVDVWGYPTEIIPWADSRLALHRYVLEDGRAVYIYYRYNAESGSYFFKEYKVYD